MWKPTTSKPRLSMVSGSLGGKPYRTWSCQNRDGEGIVLYLGLGLTPAKAYEDWVSDWLAFSEQGVAT